MHIDEIGSKNFRGRFRCDLVGVHPFVLILSSTEPEAEMERKQYATCLDHADELEQLASRWGSGGAGILTRTLEDEAQLLITEALELAAVV